MRNYNIDESSTAKHVDELHSIKRAMMVSALPKRRVKRSKKHGIHRAGGLVTFHPHRSYRQLEPTEPRHHIIWSCMLQLFEAGLRTDFTPCSEYSLSPIVVRVSSLPTYLLHVLLHTPDIHPYIHPSFHHRISNPNNARNGMQQTNNIPLDESSLKLQAFNFTSYKGRQVFLKDVRIGNCYDCCVRD